MPIVRASLKSLPHSHEEVPFPLQPSAARGSGEKRSFLDADHFNRETAHDARDRKQRRQALGVGPAVVVDLQMPRTNATLAQGSVDAQPAAADVDLGPHMKS